MLEMWAKIVNSFLGFLNGINGRFNKFSKIVKFHEREKTTEGAANPVQ